MTRHHRTLTPIQADAASEVVEVAAVTWRGWSQKGWGQRMKQKGWSLEWMEVERSVDRGAGRVCSGQSLPRGSKFDPGADLRDFVVLGQVPLSHTPTCTIRKRKK